MAKYDWSEFMVLAQALIVNSSIGVSDETLVRNETSRAYYSLLGRARRYLVDIQHDPKFRNDDSERCLEWNIHVYASDALKRSSNTDARELGEILGDLREWRNIADYDSRQAYLSPQNVLTIRQTIKKGQELLKAVLS